MSFKIGDSAKQVTPVIQGTIIDVEYNKTSNQLTYLLEWTDANGNTQHRWFLEQELEAVNVG